MTVGLSLGLFYGILLSATTLLLTTLGFYNITPNISVQRFGLIVGLGIFTSMIIATTFGTFIPIVFAKLKIDPALASGPFVTTAIDILGGGSYLYIASTLI